MAPCPITKRVRERFLAPKQDFRSNRPLLLLRRQQQPAASCMKGVTINRTAEIVIARRQPDCCALGLGLATWQLSVHATF